MGTASRQDIKGQQLILAPEIFKRTSLSFVFLNLYLLSQAYLVPVAVIGPSWVIWPALPDFALLGLVLSILSGSRCKEAVSLSQNSLLRSVLLIYGLCFLSYLVMLLGRPAGPQKAFSLIDGAYNLYRLGQFVLLFWLTIQIPLNEKRIRILARVVSVVFCIVSAGIFLTYFEVIRLGTLTAHLPRDPLVSGNWYTFAYLDAFPEVKKGLGTLSYSHAYGPIQLLLLLALRLYLVPESPGISTALYILAAIGTTILTESRAGLVSMLFFVAGYSLSNPKILIAGLVLGAVAVSTVDWRHMESSLERQQTITSATSEDNLSGRPEIWENHLNSIAEHPVYAITGGGFGSARVNGKGSNAHMLYLHLLSEVGITGLALFIALAFLVLQSLYRQDAPQRPMFWASLALLISGTTQETFYPVPGTGHFVGFYLVAVAITLHRSMPKYQVKPFMQPVMEVRNAKCLVL